MDELLVSYDTFSIYHIYDYRCDKNYYNRIIIRHDERYHVTLFFDETVLDELPSPEGKVLVVNNFYKF